MIVVDASVAVKWLFDEADSGDARELLNRHDQLQAPDLMLSEVGGAIVRRVNERVITREDGDEIAAAWTGLWASSVLGTHPLDGLMAGRAMSFAMLLGHPLPDCIYLALAMELDCPLITADRKFALRASTIHNRILILGDV
ncbi:type II toxin-antitoxin system VapC family toxin [Sphingomonas sp.]|jgi:predicted nucleic acid-binding protein|uniref:type II toxin-antitoxin system VapC family toxin n=1 Tax=Sphingomonas sp. TaxID=28214 RepID=UPI00260FF9CA|nr:type II toxin-antitoxin system VapC family toxin [Sphingomonas sp.]MDK2767730.1 type II toxin-antitoxin system VapC family toxin [Sphingomonas sp.]